MVEEEEGEGEGGRLERDRGKKQEVYRSKIGEKTKDWADEGRERGGKRLSCLAAF